MNVCYTVAYSPVRPFAILRTPSICALFDHLEAIEFASSMSSGVRVLSIA